MAELKVFYPDVKLEVDGCPVSVMNRVIIQVLRKFCRDTWYWLHDIDSLTLLQHVPDAPQTWLYQLPIPDNAELLAVDELLLHKRRLAMKSDQWLDENLPDWRNAVGTPRYFLLIPQRLVRLVPASDQTEPLAITGRVVLMPRSDAVTFPDVLLDYESGIASGVLSRLLVMNKPWANAQRGQLCHLDYLDAVSDAKSRVMQRFSSDVETIAQKSWLEM